MNRAVVVRARADPQELNLSRKIEAHDSVRTKSNMYFRHCGQSFVLSYLRPLMPTPSVVVVAAASVLPLPGFDI